MQSYLCSLQQMKYVYANLLNGPTIYRKLGNTNIARTYIDTRYRMFHPITKTDHNHAMMTSQIFVIRVL
jgi:hypothetical protein